MRSIVTIDERDCTRCGACATACPMGLIAVNDVGPATVANAIRSCVMCGHCMAACPTGKLVHRAMSSATCSALDPDWRSTPQVVEQLIKGRRSIRNYLPRPVEKATLLQLLDTVRYAPTGTNAQNVRWLVVCQADEVKKLSAAVIDWMRQVHARGEMVLGRYSPAPLIAAWEAGRDPILRGCPNLLAAYTAKDDPMGPASCTIALTTTELAALPLGLGTCWAGFLHLAAMCSQEVAQILGLPGGHIMQGALMIGYPAEKYASIPPRRPLDVTWR